MRGFRRIRSSFLPKPSDVVKPTVPRSRSRSPIGATAVTTAPPAGVTYASAAVMSPWMIRSTSSGQEAAIRRSLTGRAQRLLEVRNRLRTPQHAHDPAARVEHEGVGQPGQPVVVAHRPVAVPQVLERPAVLAYEGPRARPRVVPVDPHQRR